ncbi:hypothetical protein P3T35_000792 [Kitasatospora sp. GP30]|nr:hypothetical protein [Kitasatospora sp. GP30]
MVKATSTPWARAAATASTNSGVALPAPVATSTTPCAPASIAALNSTGSPSLWCTTTSTRGATAGWTGSGSGAGRSGVCSTQTRPKPTSPTRLPDGSAKASAATVWVFTVPRAACTLPSKTISTPRSRTVAAVTRASCRLPGPSPSAASIGSWAPVKTTGRGSWWWRSTRKAVSSRVSVPWVTTMPSTAGSASTWCTVSSRVSWWTVVRRGLFTLNRSTTSTSMPVGTAAVAITSSPRASAAKPVPCQRLAMVPPVLMTTIRPMARHPIRWSYV